MHVAIGSDHAGFELKEAVKTLLAAEHHEVVDDLVGPALAAGGRVVVMGEEWQPAEAMCRVSLDPDSFIRDAKERFVAHRMRYLVLATAWDIEAAPSGIPRVRQIPPEALQHPHNLLPRDSEMSLTARSPERQRAPGWPFARPSPSTTSTL